MQLGWIGLGHMGIPMVKRLLDGGHNVIVYNRTFEKTAPLTDRGATAVKEAQEAVRQSDIIFVMLADGPAVASVLESVTDDLTGKTIVNLSTISPEETRKMARLVEENGGTYLEVPVSGSVPVAENGQLVLLAGGDADVVTACQPYLDLLGKETIHFGPHGSGSAAKLAINLLLAVVGQGVAETLLLGEGAGLEKEKLIQMISASGMNTPLFTGKRDMYRNNDFPSAFPLRLMAKDLGLITTEAKRQQLKLPLAQAADRSYAKAKSNYGDADMAAIYRALQD
ncbi:3-hydroxyisobutyrate dehydrogenase [Exiguobacterium sp. Leaf187]|uniref:NAD(P)-dependent oxidoreductase n=1 Tax=unclassified Exiguobacterium TaxID=2644629 RepID=UPI0006F5B9F3|nr:MULTISPECIES: NAD(P)-dependent oxidoreductase [unclassified Exiguobacterium]KQS20085.1 3-hydroxyisobutyrate dehydrogenase [Exiguobacterium sp. Leaf187]